jgi:hypothetical protein
MRVTIKTIRETIRNKEYPLIETPYSHIAGWAKNSVPNNSGNIACYCGATGV